MTACQGAAGTGTQYSYAQLEGLWINAGGSKALAPTMAAIAMAESGGCSSAQNPSGATGLWQILGAVNPADQAGLTDPAVNANEAALKYETQGLGAWATYTSGAYKQYMNGATTPDTAVPAAAARSATDDGTCIGTTFPHTSWCLKKVWVRDLTAGGLMVGGGVLGLAGVIVLAAFAFRASGAAGAVAGVAGALGPVGRAAGAVGGAASSDGGAARGRRMVDRYRAAA